MSYRSDMEQFNREFNQRKRQMATILKFSVIVLAVVILATGIAVGVTWATGGFSSTSSDDAGASGGGDSKAPVITGPEGDVALAYIGEAIAYKSFVTVSDNNGTPTLEVDNSQVKTDTEGSYKVYYTATDSAGNETKYTLTLVIKKGDYSRDKLMALIAEKVNALGLSGKSKVAQVRAVYDYVNGKVAWNAAGSNTPTQKTSRSTWRVDWIEEAIRTLSVMKGDCYSYYALSRAFFEYLGIENLSIKRAEDQDEKHGTHFWNVVNIGTKESPRWYYYDATHLGGTFTADGTHNGCLMTEAKMKSYQPTSKPENEGLNMYKFDKWEGFPTIATETLK